jgi:hypothetical protein
VIKAIIIRHIGSGKLNQGCAEEKQDKETRSRKVREKSFFHQSIMLEEKRTSGADIELQMSFWPPIMPTWAG